MRHSANIPDALQKRGSPLPPGPETYIGPGNTIDFIMYLLATMTVTALTSARRKPAIPLYTCSKFITYTSTTMFSYYAYDNNIPIHDAGLQFIAKHEELF